MESQPQNPEFRNNPEKFPPCYYYQLSFHSTICFVYITETSHGDVSFTHTKYMFLKITFKIVHK